MTGSPDLSTPGAWRQTESLRLLRQVMGLSGEVRSTVAARAAMSPTELHTLEHIAAGELADDGGSIGPAEIARLLNVSTAASTGIVDRLEAKGHVQRRRHLTDRRRTEVVLTPSAREEVLHHLGPMFRGIGLADARLTDAERDVVVRYLRAALEAAESVLHPEPGNASAPGSEPGTAAGTGTGPTLPDGPVPPYR